MKNTLNSACSFQLVAIKAEKITHMNLSSKAFLSSNLN